MAGVDIKFLDFEAFKAELRAHGAKITPTLSRANYRIGALVKDTAVKYAPKSPTTAERKKRSNATKAQWKAAAKRRKKRSTSRDKPGGLMRSITFLSNPRHSEIFVALNSEAGKYAIRIHDEKGRSWHKRGPGTVAKGPEADDKFIERAVKDNENDILKILQNEAEKAIQK